MGVISSSQNLTTFAKDVDTYYRNLEGYTVNQNTKYVVVIVITVINNVKHFVFHLHARENTIGLLAGKKNTLPDLSPQNLEILEIDEAAAIREVIEESGLKLAPADLAGPPSAGFVPVNIIEEFVDGKAKVFVVKTLQPDCLDLNLWRQECDPGETAGIVAVPFATVRDWKIEKGVEVDYLTGKRPPRNASAGTMRWLVAGVQSGKYDL